MTLDLTTTNVLLGVMAAVSVLEVVAIAGVFLGTFLAYRRVLQVVDNIEQRDVAPAAERVNAILDDVKGVTSAVRQETRRVDQVIECLLDALERRRQRAGQERSRRAS